METKNNVVETGKPGQPTSAPASKSTQTPAVAPATVNAPVPAVAPAAPATPAPATPAAASTELVPAIETGLGFLPDMLDVLSTSKSRASGGAKIRPNVGYTLVADGVKKLAGTNVPEQEQVILKILNRALSTNKPVISEPELNKLVVAAHASGALKTKQDAWHIFRYYRTDLIKRGALKQVEISLAS